MLSMIFLFKICSEVMHTNKQTGLSAHKSRHLAKTQGAYNSLKHHSSAFNNNNIVLGEFNKSIYFLAKNESHSPSISWLFSSESWTQNLKFTHLSVLHSHFGVCRQLNSILKPSNHKPKSSKIIFNRSVLKIFSTYRPKCFGLYLLKTKTYACKGSL